MSAILTPLFRGFVVVFPQERRSALSPDSSECFRCRSVRLLLTRSACSHPEFAGRPFSLDLLGSGSHSSLALDERLPACRRRLPPLPHGYMLRNIFTGKPFPVTETSKKRSLGRAGGANSEPGLSGHGVGSRGSGRRRRRRRRGRLSGRRRTPGPISRCTGCRIRGSGLWRAYSAPPDRGGS